MCANLNRVMFTKKVTSKQLADLLNLSEKTVYNKCHGRSEWTYNEAIKIKTIVFPEYDLEWLFNCDTDVA